MVHTTEEIGQALPPRFEHAIVEEHGDGFRLRLNGSDPDALGLENLVIDGLLVGEPQIETDYATYADVLVPLRYGA